MQNLMASRQSLPSASRIPSLQAVSTALPTHRCFKGANTTRFSPTSQRSNNVCRAVQVANPKHLAGCFLATSAAASGVSGNAGRRSSNSSGRTAIQTRGRRGLGCRRRCQSSGVAVSQDGVNWVRGFGPVDGFRGEEGESDVGMVLEPCEDKWALDTCHLNVSDVQVFSNSNVSGGVGVYWMFFAGGDFEPVPCPPGLPGLEAGQQVEGLRMRPGLAMSQDGRNWARIEGDHHSNALMDVGPPGAWDALFIASPKVLAAGPRDMRMYYTSYVPQEQRWVAGVATSADGFRWTRRGRIFEGSKDPAAFDARGVASLHVVRDPNSRRFLMFYEGVGPDNVRSIGMATSESGFEGWQRMEAPIIRPSAEAGAWDGGSVGAPWALAMSGTRWRLYYAGRDTAAGPWQGIGMALTPEDAPAGQPPTQFRRRAAQPAA